MTNFDFKYLQELPSLIAVNQMIEKSIESEAPRISEIASYSFAQKGKQIRPILTLLVAKFCGLNELKPELVNVAAGIEMIHLATILHDDIIDQSELRRNQLTACRKFGINDTIITGDFLLVKAFGLCGLLDPSIVKATELACADLTEGEILETALHQDSHTIESSLLIAKKKTAALFRLACFSASKIAGCSPEICDKFAQFGEKLGISFQILDDILDVSANVAKFGKNLGTDLKERKPSVVNVLWLNSGNPLAEDLKTKPDVKQIDIELHLAAIKSEGILAASQHLAESFITEAQSLLNECSSSIPKHCVESKMILESLLQFILLRSK